jgi:hypothetical protein
LRLRRRETGESRERDSAQRRHHQLSAMHVGLPHCCLPVRFAFEGLSTGAVGDPANPFRLVLVRPHHASWSPTKPAGLLDRAYLNSALSPSLTVTHFTTFHKCLNLPRARRLPQSVCATINRLTNEIAVGRLATQAVPVGRATHLIIAQRAELAGETYASHPTSVARYDVSLE